MKTDLDEQTEINPRGIGWMALALMVAFVAGLFILGSATPPRAEQLKEGDILDVTGVCLDETNAKILGQLIAEGGGQAYMMGLQMGVAQCAAQSAGHPIPTYKAKYVKKLFEVTDPEGTTLEFIEIIVLTPDEKAEPIPKTKGWVTWSVKDNAEDKSKADPPTKKKPAKRDFNGNHMEPMLERDA